MSRARRWGFPSLLVSMGLHGALVGTWLLSRPQTRAARQPELLAMVAMVGSSVEVEAPAEALVAPSPEPTPEPEPEPAPPLPRAVNALATEQRETKATGTSDQKWPFHGVLSLGHAIARAIPQAAPADAAWRALPVGHVGTIRIELAVDKSHHVSVARRLRAKPDEPSPPAVLEGLVERVLLMLRGEQFALSGSNQPGVEQLAIDVAIRARASDEQGADTVVEKSFSGGTPARPGKAYFRYGSGCAVEATVTVVRSRP